MLSRLETMVLMGMELPLAAIRRQIVSAIDIMVHLGRMRDKSRKVLEILEILGYNRVTGEIETQPLFLWEDGVLVKKHDLSGKKRRRSALEGGMNEEAL